jgi:hypothetical protein
MNPLDLETVEETLHRRVVVAVSLATHRGRDPVELQQLLVVVTAVLRTAVAVMKQTRRRPASKIGHAERFEHELAVGAMAHRPANDQPRVQTEDAREIQPTLVGPDVADIGEPHLVGPLGLESLLQQVRRHRQVVV